MTAKRHARNGRPNMDFLLLFKTDMIGAGGLLYLIDQGIDIPADWPCRL